MPDTVYRLYQADDHDQLELASPSPTWLDRHGPRVGLLACGASALLSLSAIVTCILYFAL